MSSSGSEVYAEDNFLRIGIVSIHSTRRDLGVLPYTIPVS